MKAMGVAVAGFAACAVVSVGGCKSGSPSMSRTGTVVAPATPAEVAMLEKIKSLEGTWEMQGGMGGQPATIVFHTGGGGHTVREIMFPGDEHEMTNMYHLDGRSLVMTHYCAIGNQPRMRARAGGDPNSIAFTFDSVTNKTSADQTYMGEMTLTFVDADTIREDWVHFEKGKPGAPTSFELKRKR
jgi:hypothetical protein